MSPDAEVLAGRGALAVLQVRLAKPRVTTTRSACRVEVGNEPRA
jgi:hypothetical protein